MNDKRRLLIVEDERPILDGLTDVFVFHGYQVDSAEDGAEGLKKALSDRYDLIILDVMLPTLDGYSICNELRQNDRTTPIIMLTAKSSEDDIITGLSLGADDYIAKPFSIKALLLRVEAILRRTIGEVGRDRFLQIGNHLLIDCSNLHGERLCEGSSDEALEYTRREVDILKYLLRHEDRPVSRSELLLNVWGYQKASEIETRTVDIHIAKLRRKIEQDHRNPVHLVTVRGEGYRLLQSQFVVK